MGYGQYSANGRPDRNPQARGRVFDNSMVAHVWAAQSQDSGRSNNGQFFFDGPTLYSYGHHFPAGIILPDGVALLNADKYSPTTSKHMSYARHAVSHRTSYMVPGLRDLPILAFVRCTDKDGRTVYGNAIKRYVRENVRELSSDAAAYLLALVGVKNTARAIVHMIRDANRADEKAKAAHDRNLRAIAAGKARQLAAMGPDGIRAWARGSGDCALSEYTFSNTILDLQKVVRLLPKSQKNRIAIVKFAIAAVKESLADFEVREARRKANRDLRTNAKCIRANLKEHLPPEQIRFDYLADAAQHIANRGRALGGLKRESFVALATEARAKHAEQVERLARERMERERAAREMWLKGGPAGRLSDAKGGALIRVVNDELQTSWGARVPLAHAIRAFRFLKLCRETGRTWHANGRTIHVGHFRIERVDATGDFKAGCHVIHWEEVERLARELGVFDAPADDSALVPSNHAA